MKNLIVLIGIFLFSTFLYSQNDQEEVIIDSLYREDQFYAGVTYNLLGNLPSGVSQNGFSSGFLVGFIRDMPINKNRNLAVGLGLGYSTNSFNQNLQITNDSKDNYSYTVLDDNTEFSKNKFSQHLIEIPLEFRWRSSSPSEYKFWRIYTGFKTSYVIASTSKYIGNPEDIKNTKISDFNDFQYALTLSFGYNTWNFYLNYTLNPIFQSDVMTIAGNAVDMKAIKIGLIFYIL